MNQRFYSSTSRRSGSTPRQESTYRVHKEIVGGKKVTIILTTHYMEEADHLCDRLAIIDRGKMVALDTPARLKKSLGGDVVILRTEKPDMRAVKKLDYVTDVKYEKGVLMLTVNDASSHLQKILNAVGEVKSVESRSPTLQDVFIRLTGKEIRDHGEEGGVFERMLHIGAALIAWIALYFKIIKKQ